MIPAVCIPPATRLLVRNIGERMQREHGLHDEEECTFEQLTATPNTYRDAIRFQNGCCLRIQELPEKQRVVVLGAVSASGEPEGTIEDSAVLRCA